jgi:hypothetical protein
LVLSVFAFACGSDDSSGEEAYDTYQECFDDHTMVENLEFQKAVVVCCIDHEIGGQKLACGATSADCVTYLGTNLTSSATQADVQAACDEYETQKGQ